MWTGLSSLENLTLDQNLIQNLPAAAFGHLNNLKFLGLSQNKISEIRGSMWEGLHALEQLDLNFNLVYTFHPAAFSPLQKLKKLTLQRTRVREIKGDMWLGLSSLEVLNLIDSHTRNLQAEAFKPLSSLKELNLANTFIQVIRTDTLTGMVSLTYLDLSLCNIGSLQPGAFTHLPNLNFLNLTYGRLTSLEMNRFLPDNASFESDHPKNLTLDLRINYWNCDRRMCWLRKGEKQGWVHFKEKLPQCTNSPRNDWHCIDYVCEPDLWENEDDGSGSGSWFCPEL